jgi:hypothetical protein
VLLAIALIPLAVGACSTEGSTTSHVTSPPKTTADPAIGSTLPEGPSVAINAAANDSDRSFPLDATPSPDGSNVYYTALSNDADGNRVAGVFSVAADGGNVTMLASGDPLAAPVGITTSADGNTLFVADPGADVGGGILTVPSGGGGAAVLMGTTGYRPQGVTVAEVNGKSAVYFTGIDPTSGDAGVFSVDPAGGTVVALATGSPFGEPGGVTVTSSGDAFVADALSANGTSAVIRVSGGTASVFVDRIGVGFPAGITALHDDSTLVVSGLDPATQSDIVYFVDVAAGKLSALTDTVGAFHTPAGLHRAHDADVFAWADSRANDTGTVYVLRP